MSERNRVLKILARATDHQWGENGEAPSVPSLPRKDALTAFLIRMFLVVLNVGTCISVMLNVWRHW